MVLIGRLDDRLTNSRLVVRCATLLAVAVVVFVCCWSLAYLLLPVGSLRGRTGGAVLAGGDQAASSFAVELARIFAINFALVAVVVVAPNLLRTRRGVPLGYWSAMMMVAVAGVVTGTNSFSIQVGSAEKLAPSLELLGNPGPYELAAYVVAGTASFGLGRWQLVGRWPHSTAPRLASEPVQVRPVVLGLCAATAILFAMAAWEAHRIIEAVS
jgi:hypothetical protein